MHPRCERVSRGATTQGPIRCKRGLTQNCHEMNVFGRHLARDWCHGKQRVSPFYHDLGLDLVGLMGTLRLLNTLLHLVPTRSSLSGHVDGEASLQDLTTDRVVAGEQGARQRDHFNLVIVVWPCRWSSPSVGGTLRYTQEQASALQPQNKDSRHRPVPQRLGWSGSLCHVDVPPLLRQNCVVDLVLLRQQ